MKTKIWILPIGFSLVLIGFLGLAAVSDSRPPTISEVAGQSSEIEELLKTVRIKTLMQTDPERLVKAIERLGQLRALTAIDDLTELLTFRRTFKGEEIAVAPGRTIINASHLYSPDERYPAIRRALRAIGELALPVLVRVIETNETGSRASENAAYTVGSIFRDEPAREVNYLSEAAATVSTPEGKNRLLKAVEAAKKYVR